MKNSNLEKLDSLINIALDLEAAHEADKRAAATATLSVEKQAPRAGLDATEFWAAVKRVDRFEFSPECSFTHSSEIGEKFRELRANLQTLQVDKGVKTLVFSSSHHNEGKTHTAVNTARFIAQNKGRRTLLVDCDLRRPCVKSHIFTEPDHYLEDVLTGKCQASDAAVYSEQDNLAVILTRHGQPNATEMLEAPAMAQFLATVRRAFDFVIIDTSPILSTTDPMILGAMSDGVILVVKTGFTQRESVEHAISLMYQSNAKVLGVVLSQMKNYIPKYLYKYHYFSDAYSDYYTDANQKEPRSRKSRKAENKDEQPVG
jgi:capsular exopolysaccharide synthesis family protein